MSARKGGLTAGGIDRGWPFQIALDGALCTGEQSSVQDEFCKGLSRCVRGHSLFRDDKVFVVQCFSLKEDAEKFKAQFGGEWFDPRERGRRHKWTSGVKESLPGDKGRREACCFRPVVLETEEFPSSNDRMEIRKITT